MLTFKEYNNKEIYPGKGWQLYNNGSASAYYFFIKKDEKDYELFYGNGFFIARSKEFYKIKELTIKIYQKYPLMGFDTHYVNSEFIAIQEIAKQENFDTTFDFSFKDE